MPTGGSAKGSVHRMRFRFALLFGCLKYLWLFVFMKERRRHRMGLGAGPVRKLGAPR